KHTGARSRGGGGIGRTRCRRVPGRCENQGARASINCSRDRHCHAAVLERASGIYALVLDEDLATASDPRAQLWRGNKRRVPFAQRYNRFALWKKFTKWFDDPPAPFHCCAFHRQFSFEINPRDCRGATAVVRSTTVCRSSPKRISCVYSRSCSRAGMPICVSRT